MKKPTEPAEPEDERESHRQSDAKLDTVQQRDKRSGKSRPTPGRASADLIDPSWTRIDALVVGTLPQHVEIVPAHGRGITRADVKVAKVPTAILSLAGSSLVVGDRVQVAVSPDGDHWVADFTPRTGVLLRPEVERGSQPQPLVSGAKTLWGVVSMREPELKAGFIDRLFVAAAAGGMDAALVATKTDLEPFESTVETLDRYAALGFRIRRVSTVTGEGIDALRAELVGDFAVFLGQSGVGKSSLVRVLLPGALIAVGEVSGATKKGRHTTTVTRYYALPDGGAVVDTPGLRELGLWKATHASLDAAFPDIAALAVNCRFGNCGHLDEPGCAVAEADLDPERIVSYWKLREEVDLRARPSFNKPGGVKLRP